MTRSDETSIPKRYHRQALLREIGPEGQRRLGTSHALIVGCGALGTVSAEMLARAGVGRLTLVDRDVVEVTNLQRQTLFDEADAREGAPKVDAARRRLAAINSSIAIRALGEDFSPRNARRIAGADGEWPAPDVIVDGTDNFETRYLMNDLAVELGVPYIYGAAVGTIGMLMPIIPASAIARLGLSAEPTPCLRCLFEDPPAPGGPDAGATCDTVGVLGPVVATIANMQAVEAIKLLVGAFGAVSRSLTSMDLWAGSVQPVNVSQGRRDECPCCGLRRFDFLDAATPVSAATTLCGRNTIQVAPGGGLRVDLAALAERLAPHGDFSATRFLVRGRLTSEPSASGAPIELTVFADGRALFTGIDQPERARALYARYIGA